MIGAADWSPSDGLSLEPNALAAATETERNIALTAGPGSGKTELLAQRADFLLRTGVCRFPKRILAISFKVDASRNLRERVIRRCGVELATRFDSYTFHAFAKRLIDRFRPALTGRDALDPDYLIGQQRITRKAITFADMVPLAEQIIQSSHIARNAVRLTYSHVFLDEFQDCTAAQYKLIQACFRGTNAKLTAVGDTKQRIMGWAGALEGVFQTYADDFGARSLNLYQNFRSEPRLRRMQNAVIRRMDPPAALDDEDFPGEAGEIEIVRFESADDEASETAETIKLWIEQESVEPAEIAVLVSKQQNLYCQQLRAAFEANGIPYRDEDRLQDLSTEPIASVLIDFLLVVAAQRQSSSYRRLLNLIVFNRDLDEVREHRIRSGWDQLVLETRRRVTDGEFDVRRQSDLFVLVEEFCKFVGDEVLLGLSSDYERGGRLQQLIDDTVGRASDLLNEMDDVSTALGCFSGNGAVRIMSIHKSKGLEFDVVVLLGVEKETFWGNADVERSAFFVAISRAKRRLRLTVSKRRERPEGAPQRWEVPRSEHKEFLAYAEPYV